MASTAPISRPSTVNAAAGPGSTGLVHDYLLVMRGAERTFAAIAECFPEAPIYTTAYSEPDTEGGFAGRRIHTSYLQRLRVRQRWFGALLPLYPHAVGRLPIANHDLIVSSSVAFAHGIDAGAAVHVCYCHTPFRYAWHERERALARVPAPLRPFVARTLDRIRRWDLEAASRVTAYVANSEITRQRIADWYGRDAAVVHPPVDVERFAPGEPSDYFLCVGELVAHKRTEVALEAARLADAPIKVVGGGAELDRLERLYGGSAELLGRVSDEELAGLYAGARAVVIPNVEEFGIVAVEAQAAGRPVIALDAGGARETVVDGRTGVLVPDGTPTQLAEAMRSVDFDRFAVEELVANARRFSPPRFRKSLIDCVRRVLDADRD